MELSLETSQIPHLICFSFYLNSSFFCDVFPYFLFLGNVEHFERTWRIICRRNDEYSGSIPTFSRSFCMSEKVKVQKKATVTTGLYGTTFCLPGPGRRNGVCRISVLGEQSFAQVLECGGGVCLCSPSPSLSRRILTAWWYSLSTLP